MGKCKAVQLNLSISAQNSHTGQERMKICDIDACIADIVTALNNAGILTDACCCGHGRELGDIILRDGRRLYIFFSHNSGHKE